MRRGGRASSSCSHFAGFPAFCQDGGADREELSIPLRRETRAKVEQLAEAEGQATARPVTAAELAAAVVEQFVATAPGG